MLGFLAATAASDDADARRHLGRSLFAACGHSPFDKAALLRLLEGANADSLKHRGLGGMSPLLRCVERQDDGDVVRAMLARGAELDATTSVGYSALTYAAMHNKLESARELLRAGADPHVADSLGLTAFDHAHHEGHDEMVALLDAHGGAARSQRAAHEAAAAEGSGHSRRHLERSDAHAMRRRGVPPREEL